MLNIIMIIIKICATIILSIFLGGVFYGIYTMTRVSLDKKPKKLADWLMTNEEYEEYVKLVEDLKNKCKRN